VARRRLRGARPGSERLDPHAPHQPLHALAVDAQTLCPQHCGHPTRAEKRVGRIQLVEPPHQRQIVVVGRPLRPVHPGSAQRKQLALPSDRQIGMIAVEQNFPVRLAHRPDLLDKKSRSTVNCPILA